MSDGVFAGVIIDQIHPSLDKIFHYSIPHLLEDKIQIGMRVVVPFGSRTIQGYVMSLDDKIDFPVEKLKPIKKVLDPYPVINKLFIPLMYWMKKEYHCLYIEAISCFISPGIRKNINNKTQKIVYLNVNVNKIDEIITDIKKRSPKMVAILKALKKKDGIPLKELLNITNATRTSINSLKKHDYIKLCDEEIYRDPWQKEISPTTPPEYTKEQIKAIQIINSCKSNGNGVVLLHGVTGSGKTEVYMKVVLDILHKGKQAIILVPEIALTPQTVSRFKNRFGANIAILHSRLSSGEHYDEWRRIRDNKVDIVIGARSAVFAPLNNLGLIIIDEFHEDSYKSDMRPRYHAKDIAKKRCELEGATLVLGSATPSIEDYYKANIGQYQLATIKKRIENHPLPQVDIIDMRDELKKGNRSIFSQALHTAINNTLKKNEQAIILLNRRGYAQFVSCRSCGFVVKCINCDVSLTYHAKENVLKCHYCGYKSSYPNVCPECGSKYIKKFGIGTEKVEDEIVKLFPKARILRMDADTTSKKNAHYNILSAFKNRKYDILLGTQMVAKGLDFPNVTLVGVIAADTSLNIPDYRSSEKTFQLITQVAGRTGRGYKGGKAIIQTYQPEHYAIQYASNHDYIGFYNKEIEIRQQFVYPPFSHIIRFLITGESEIKLAQFSKNMLEWIRDVISKGKLLKEGLIDIGDYPAPIERIKNQYRWQILVKIKPIERYKNSYHELCDEVLDRFYQETFSIALDFNPLSLL